MNHRTKCNVPVMVTMRTANNTAGRNRVTDDAVAKVNIEWEAKMSGVFATRIAGLLVTGAADFEIF